MAIKVALDSCTVINLSKLDNPRNDPDNVVHDLLKTKKLMPSKFKRTAYSKLPPLLQDSYLGKIEKIDGKEYYKTLIDLEHLLEAVKRGEIELCITKTVFNELNLDKHASTKKFVENYVNILRVPDELKQTFAIRRTKLAREYVARDAMDDEYSASEEKRVPTNDAYIMAEATIFGLTLITFNGKDFIFIKNNPKSWERLKVITEINKEKKYFFESNISGVMMTPKPTNLSAFIGNYKHYLRGDDTNPFVTTEYNLNEANEFSLS